MSRPTLEPTFERTPDANAGAAPTPSPPARRRRPMRARGRIALGVAGLLLALLAAEGLARLLGTEPRQGWHLENGDGAPLDPVAALHDGTIVRDLPRGRQRFAKEFRFYLCYHGGSSGEPSRVAIDINRFGLRDRADLTEAKPAGERRIVCIGDSFTFGWGVPIDETWPRLVEQELAAANVRTINGGLAGSLYIDEAWWALRDRLHVFAPDAVLLSICLNDLVPLPEQLVHRDSGAGGVPWWRGWSRLLDRLTAQAERRRRLHLDPAVDWGRRLLDLPADAPHWQASGATPDLVWSGGGPQQALREMRAFCAARGIGLGVVVWPLMQGLRAEDRYPFAAVHQEVVDFCAREDIACLDLLPVFRGQDPLALWVDDSDQHVNGKGQRLAAGPIARFIERARLLAR